MSLKFDRMERMTSETYSPKVSVIMPVYNAELFLKESIDSILRQTFSDFEFIIINDGSTDKSQSIIDTYAKHDSRIVAIKQDNKGVVATANMAITLAKGLYIARMDADDISMPDRLQQEVAILDSKPNTILVCSSFEIFDKDGEFRYKDVVAPGNEQIKRSLYLRNPIANGSTLIRKQSLVEAGLFDDVFAEDFKMWTKLALLGDFESTGTMLYRWRMNPSGLTLSNNSLSMSKGDEYIASLWLNKKPETISLKDIQKMSNLYLNAKTNRAKGYREVFLTDISQLSAKLFTNGHYIDGIHQFFALAFSGKDGFKAAARRVQFIAFGHFGKLRKKISIKRTPFDNIA